MDVVDNYATKQNQGRLNPFALIVDFIVKGRCIFAHNSVTKKSKVDTITVYNNC